MTSAEFVEELKPLLEARPGLAGVQVHLTEPQEPKAPEIVLLSGRVRHDVTWIAMGPRRQDAVVIPGVIRTWADTLTAAETAAMAIAQEIGLQLKTAAPQVGAATLKAELSEVNWEPFKSDRGGYDIDAQFAISYLSDLA